jgi:hypothetical protein
VKISNKKNSFFSSRNQYFPHIPYVASKNDSICKIETIGQPRKKVECFRWYKQFKFMLLVPGTKVLSFLGIKVSGFKVRFGDCDFSGF